MMKIFLFTVKLAIILFYLLSCESREQAIGNKNTSILTPPDTFLQSVPDALRKLSTDTLFYISSSITSCSGTSDIRQVDNLAGVLEPMSDSTTSIILVGHTKYCPCNLIVKTARVNIKVKISGRIKGYPPETQHLLKYASVVGPEIELTSIELFSEASEIKGSKKQRKH
jgi:hypothetical protein